MTKLTREEIERVRYTTGMDALCDLAIDGLEARTRIYIDEHGCVVSPAPSAQEERSVADVLLNPKPLLDEAKDYYEGWKKTVSPSPVGKERPAMPPGMDTRLDKDRSATHYTPSPSVEELVGRLERSGDPDNGYDGYVIRKACRDAAATLTRLKAELSQARTESIWRSWPDGPHGPRHYSDIDGVKGRDGAEIVTPFQVAELEAELSRKDEELEATRNQVKVFQHGLFASTQREAALREALAEMVQQFKGQLRRDAWEFEIGFDAAKEAIAKARAALADRKEG